MSVIAFVFRAALQWALWVGGNLVGLFWSWTIARGVALVLAESPGASLGDGGEQDLALGLGTPAGAPMFVVTYAAVLACFQWPILRTWGGTGRAVDPPRTWLWIAYAVFLPTSVLLHSAQNWVLGEAYPVFAEPLLLTAGAFALVALLGTYVLRRPRQLPAIDRALLLRRVGWVALASLAFGVWLARARHTWLEGYAPWESGDSCMGCGSVITTTMGVQVAMATGVVLLWQFRRPTSAPSAGKPRAQ